MKNKRPTTKMFNEKEKILNDVKNLLDNNSKNDLIQIFKYADELDLIRG